MAYKSLHLRASLKKINKTEWPLFSMAKNEIKLHVQYELFERDNRRKAHITMGLFYELLCTGLFGGTLTDRIDIKVNHKNIRIEPDVFCFRQKKIIESKGHRTGGKLNLLDDQVEKYKDYQMQYPDFEIYYVIWNHTLREITSYSQRLEMLFKDLSEQTVCALILPFSIILKMHENRDPMFFRRYDSDRWYRCVAVSSRFLNLPFLDSEMFFHLLSLNGSRNNFLCDYYLLPEGIKINQFEIKPFPIVWIKDLNYKQWAEELADDRIPF